ncbi:MAG TPA: SDR family oxidoreductase [Deltaproteobacteria bacterium]|nr:SDR family oxidoreductase [Deltaproteobacteria bacterium]
MNEERIFLITGAASGIGLSIAEKALEEGATVVAADLDEPALKANHERLGDRYVARASDAGNVQAIEDLIGFIDREFGRLDVLVNNAGAALLSRVEDVVEDAYDTQMNVLLKGPIFLVKSAARLLRAAPDGVVINIASASAVLSMHNYCPYGIAKGAIVKFTEDCVISVPGIRHNTVLPGFVETPGFVGANDEDVLAQIRAFAEAHNPVPRVGAVDDISEATMFLASPKASYITGAKLLVDGGLSRLHPLTMPQ